MPPLGSVGNEMGPTSLFKYVDDSGRLDAGILSGLDPFEAEVVALPRRRAA
jgi:hypothetical protein